MTLLRYTIGRLLRAVTLLFGVLLVAFLLVNSIPGDPVALATEGQNLDQESIQTLEQRYDQPVSEQFVDYLSGAATGDLGTSLHHDRAVTDLLLERIPVTLLVGVTAFTLATMLAVPLGVFAARGREGIPGRVSRGVELVGASTPAFWAGILLVLVFAVHLEWLPAEGLVVPWSDPAEHGYASQVDLYAGTIRHLLLPTAALGALQVAVLMRVERSSMVDSLGEGYARLARAYGVPERTVVRKHAFRPAQTPTTTAASLYLSTLLGGVVLIEHVFGIEGVGGLFVEAVDALDYDLVIGTTAVLVGTVLLGAVVVDVAGVYLDPHPTEGPRSNGGEE